MQNNSNRNISQANGLPSNHSARTVIHNLLSGEAPNGITPDSCGQFADAISALYEAHHQGGTDNVRKLFDVLAKRDTSLARLTSGGNNPLENLSIFTAADLGAMDIPEPTYLVDGVIPEGCSLLSAKPKIGKSLFALGVAYAIACGGKALGSIQVKKAEVLYLALEGAKRGLKRRLEQLACGSRLPASLHISQEWPSKDDGGYDLLEKWMDVHPDTGLIIVDTLKGIRGKGDSRRSAYDLDYDSIIPLSDLAEKASVSILIIHHNRKLETGDPMDVVSGTFGLTGAVDNVMVMERQRGQADAKLTIMPREEEEAELALKFDASISNWKLLGDASIVAKSGERQLILNVLRESSAEDILLTPAQIAKEIGKESEAVRQLLKSMKEDSQVTSPKWGKYKLHPLINTDHNDHNDHISEG